LADDATVDCRGLACPQPVIRTREALEGARGKLVVIVDNEGSCTNVSRFAESQGHAVEVERRHGDFHVRIVKGEASPIACATAGRDMVVYVSSETMGRGDDELGGILMAAFLDTLSQLAAEISHVIFVNAGVKLVMAGSPVLEQIGHLEQMGTDLLVCGTCLNHFGLKDELAVGRVSNMLAIIETLSGAGRVLRP
jgi:selenium metabolism protein YedF